jgi:hypothetical protein
MRYPGTNGDLMRLRKPGQLPTKSFIFRPQRDLTGKYSIGFGMETSGPGAAASFSWCGSRRQISLLPQLSSYVTNLRLPVNIAADDVFVLTLTAPFTVILTINVWKEGEPTEDLVVEDVDGETSVQTVCANPATDRDRKFDEPLVLGQAPVAARRQTPVGRIDSLRDLPEGALLYLNFHRLPNDTSAEDLLVTASLGPMRRLCVIAAGRPTNGITFWLQPDAAGESWPLSLSSPRPFAWSGALQRGYDAVFLPAFSFVE